MKISAVILTRDEEKNIIDCLEALKWCDEIIVIDDNSGDRTVEIAKKYGSQVYVRFLNNDFSEQRNFGLSKAKGDWILFVDADERVPEALASEISNIKDQISDKINGFYIKRKDYMWGKELNHGETGNIKLLRLARKESGKWEGRVHEEWKIEGNIGEFKNSILHYPHQTIKEFLQEINFYTDLRAKELYDKKVRANWVSILAYTKGKFILNFILKRGFMDGLEGFIFAIIMSFHSFLVRGKLWSLYKKNGKEYFK